MENIEIMEVAMQQSAHDCSCTAEDFRKPENSVHESFASEAARKYLKLPHICNLVSYGTNIVACGKKELLPEIKKFIDSASSIEHCFETPDLYVLNDILAKFGARVCFMAEYFLPDIEQVYRVDAACSYEMRIMGPDDFAGLYIPAWSNALCEDRKHLDVLGIGAYDNGKLIGLAGCSADCDTMWQIGVDVLPEYRRRGIASALTNRLAREIFERDKVPFYCAAWSNVKSVKNAIRSGFRPGWVEVTAKPNAAIVGDA
ncbi:MAG TPA: GNAT family N-acetyltransferase [Lachnospiraceae bacterium]|nr:GNAT family N-acetyltransferase [Lachnospiraceae bacterium]